MAVWFWYTAVLYRYSSTVTAPFPSPFVATICKPSLLYLGFLTLPFSPSFLPFPFPSSPEWEWERGGILSPLSHSSYICLHSCYIGVHCTISTYTGFATLATPRFRYRCSAMLTLKMKKTTVTLSDVHTNIRQIWRTTNVEQCGFKPCQC